MSSDRAFVAAVDDSSLRELETAWRELERHATPNPFLGFDWMYSWWRTQGVDRRPFVIGVEDATGCLIGLAPLTMSRKESRFGAGFVSLKSAAGSASDRLGFLSKCGREREVVAGIATYLQGMRPRWHYIELRNVPDDAPELELLPQMVPRGSLVQRLPAKPCPFVRVENDWASHVAGLPKRKRSEIRRLRRRFEDDLGGRVTVCSDEDEVRRALAFMFEHSIRRCRGKGTTSTFEDVRFQAFHMEVAPRLLLNGNLELQCLLVDERIAAVEYTLRSRDRVFTYNGAFDERFASLAPGILGMTYLLERAFDGEIVEVDLLRGDESYKFHWATGLRHQSNLRLTRAGTAVARAFLLRGWKGFRRRMKRRGGEAIDRPLNVADSA